MSRRNEIPQPPDAVRAASYPHPYPEGWYRLALSKSLRRGDIRYLECLGSQFVLWRERNSGNAYVMNAFCPHLGANLAFGRVRGDCIECPFHAWRFGGEGRVRHIPYSDQPPDRVLAQTFPVRELHGQIFIYYRGADSTLGASDPPPYELPRIAEVDEGRFVWRGHHEGGRVRMHIIEFCENAVDLAHFQPVHGELRIPWTQITVPGVRIEHTVEWALDPECSWKMYLSDRGVLKIGGRRVERTTGTGRATFLGPGSVVMFRFTIPDQGEIELYQTHLPVAPLEQQVDFRWFADRNMPRLLVWYVIGNWIAQWKRDIEIWENKVYRAQPRLCRDDGPVYAMRRWYRQFLPNDSEPAVSQLELMPPDRPGDDAYVATD